MPYTSNPYVGKTRRLAVNDIRVRGLTQAQVARKYGVTRSAVCKWVKRASKDHREFIETLPSSPKHHPNQLAEAVVNRIIVLRKRLNRCAPIIHAHLAQEGICVSLSSVARTLRRHKLTHRKRAKFYSPIPRPPAHQPGDLVQMDTIHFIQPDYSRRYVYAVLDVCSRLGYAEYQPKLSQRLSLKILRNASKFFGFKFKTVQTDNGPEFGQRLSLRLRQTNTQLRHSRVRTPNDNAHVERFIRTIQEECIKGRMINEQIIPQQLSKYIKYYNTKRLHLALNCLTPRSFVSKVLR
jgi:transposase InsO family protein